MRPVRDYFPEISAEGTGEVLVHHLLCHLSGWRDIDIANEAVKRRKEVAELPPPEPGQHRDIADLLYLTRATPLACRPGEAMQYCDHNFELLGELVRRVSGLSIEQFAKERLFEPLGMDDSSYVLAPEHRARKVRRGEGMPGTEFRSRLDAGVDSERSEGQPWGGRGMHTSARDYAVFAQMLLNNGTYRGLRILSRASVEAMRRDHIPAGVPVRSDLMTPDGEQINLTGGYGYGLFPFGETVTANFNGGLASPASFSHGGAGGIYWWADPERELIGIYLSVAAIVAETAPDWRADLFVDAMTAAVED
jgi:CubicO group peptidase (beta-lactamase class C family)